VSLLLWAASFAQAANPVTFQVDMTSQPGATDVYVAGSFNGWNNSLNPLMNNGSGVYTGTVDIADSPGTVEQCKFLYNPGGVWESDPNRQFLLAGGAQTLPLTAWNEKYPAPTNNVTFRVNMGPQVTLGLYTPGDPITVAGDFTGWGDGAPLTNNPALTGNASNIYSGVVPVTGFAGGTPVYKFRANFGWENPSSTAGGNRTFVLAGGDQTLPLVLYNDDELSDLLPVDTMVTFNVNMTNAVSTDSITFDASVNHVYLNGDFLGWRTWDAGSLAAYEMTNNPVGSLIYSLTVPFLKGSRLLLTYKYSIDGPDNEAAFNQNHIRYPRKITNYNMPLDKFGNQYQEPSFGQLSIGAASAGQTRVSWLGRPGVHLQITPSLGSAPVWQDRFETDGTNWTTGITSTNGFISFTNYPTSGSRTFFRLIKPTS